MASESEGYEDLQLKPIAHGFGSKGFIDVYIVGKDLVQWIKSGEVTQPASSGLIAACTFVSLGKFWLLLLLVNRRAEN